MSVEELLKSGPHWTFLSSLMVGLLAFVAGRRKNGAEAGKSDAEAGAIVVDSAAAAAGLLRVELDRVSEAVASAREDTRLARAESAALGVQIAALHIQVGQLEQANRSLIAELSFLTIENRNLQLEIVTLRLSVDNVRMTPRVVGQRADDIHPHEPRSL